MATVQQIDERLQQIQIEASKHQQALNNLSVENNQLLGYKQALVDSQNQASETSEATNNTEKTLLNE